MVAGSFLEEKKLAESTFDLRNTLADQDYPTDTVDVWLDRKIGRELAALEEKIADETDPEKLKALEEEFDQKKRKFAESKYTFHITGIPLRQKEDLQLKALEKYPFQRDPFGRDDDAQALKRNRYLRTLIFEAQTTKLVRWDGAVQSNLDLAFFDWFTGQAPDHAINALDRAIGKINEETDIQRFGQQDPDFLSES